MRNFNILAMMAVAVVGLSACSSSGDDMFLGSRDDIIINNKNMPKEAAEDAVASKIETVKEDARIAAQDAVIEQAKEEVSSVDITPTQTATMETIPQKTTVEPVVPATAVVPSNMAGDIPPNARPGECYAKVLIPAVTQTKTDRVQVSEEQQVLDRIIPAQYRVETEQILVKPARQYWKAGHGPITKKDEVTGEIMCLVEEPAEYKTIEKRILVEPEKPQYKTVPAQFETVTTKEVVQGERWEWRRILCETNMGSDSILRIQQALRAKGYNLVIDGRLGDETLKALSDYQTKNGLATRGITYETLESLGVQLIGA